MQRPKRFRDTAGRTRDRGVSQLIGFVLVFAVLIISWSVYQGFEVPTQNEQAEFEHNQRVQQELRSLQNDLLRTGRMGVPQASTITVGADYPRRTIAVNFGAPGGTVKTRDTAPRNDNTLYIRNIAAIDAETRDYLNSTARELNYTTKSIVFVPSYTRYTDAPETVIAGGAGAVFNDFGQSNVSIEEQVIISDRTITIVAIDGNLSKSRFREGATVSVETKPLSVATNTVTIENESGRINITLPTRIDDIATWNESGIESEFVPEGYVEEITRPSDDYISIILQNGTYNLRMIEVGVGTDTAQPKAKYLTDVEKPRGSVVENSSNVIRLEVRDKFNNPVSGVQVNGSIYKSTANENGTLSVISRDSKSSNKTNTTVSANTSNGQIAFDYTAPSIDSRATVSINFTIRSHEHSYEQVWVNLSVFSISDDELTANASAPDEVGEGGSITLDGSQSEDSDGSIDNYSWSITSGVGSIVEDGTNTPNATYEAPDDVNGDIDVTVELTVEDNDGNTDTDTVTFTIIDTSDSVNDPGPSGNNQAFIDNNGNGLFDSGTDEKVSVGDLKTFNNQSANLVIPSDVSINGGQVDIQAKSVYSQGSIQPNNQQVQITSKNGNVYLGGPVSTTNGRQIQITAEGGGVTTTANIDADGQVQITGKQGPITLNGNVTSNNGQIQITAENGALNASDNLIKSGGGNDITLTSNGDMRLNSTIIDAGSGSAKAEVKQSGILYVDELVVDDSDDILENSQGAPTRGTPKSGSVN